MQDVIRDEFIRLIKSHYCNKLLPTTFNTITYATRPYIYDRAGYAMLVGFKMSRSKIYITSDVMSEDQTLLEEMADLALNAFANDGVYEISIHNEKLKLTLF